MSGDHYVVAGAQREQPQYLAQAAPHQVTHDCPADASADGEPVPTVREIVGLQRDGEQAMTCASPAARDGGEIPTRAQSLTARGVSRCRRD